MVGLSPETCSVWYGSIATSVHGFEGFHVANPTVGRPLAVFHFAPSLNKDKSGTNAKQDGGA